MEILIIATLGALVFAIFTFLAHARSLSGRNALIRENDCQAPRVRSIRDQIRTLYSRIRKTRSLKLSKSFADGVDLHKQYGQTYSEYYWPGTTINTCSAKNLQAIFGTRAQDYGVQPFRLAGMKPFCGEGLLTTDGAVWERSRKMIRPSFHHANISDLSDFKRSIEILSLRLPRDRSTVDLQPLLSLMFFDTSTRFLLGHPIGVMENENVTDAPIDGQSFLKAWQRSLRSSAIRNLLGVFRFMMSKSETRDQWQVVHSLIDFHVNQVMDDVAKNDKGHSRTLLQNLSEQTTDRIEIRNQIIQGMLAAQDTTPGLISNALFLLSRSPQTWDRLRSDVAHVDLAAVNAEDTIQIRTLRNILNETLRLYPIFPKLARIALKDSILVEGGGTHGDHPIFVAAGSRILPDFYTLHRNEDVYGKSVETFEPNRWESIQPGSWEFMPFGGGQRACLGQHKALAEASYTLMWFAQKFKRIESRDDREWAGDQKLTAKNANGCKVSLSPA